MINLCTLRISCFVADGLTVCLCLYFWYTPYFLQCVHWGTLARRDGLRNPCMLFSFFKEPQWHLPDKAQITFIKLSEPKHLVSRTVKFICGTGLEITWTLSAWLTETVREPLVWGMLYSKRRAKGFNSEWLILNLLGSYLLCVSFFCKLRIVMMEVSVNLCVAQPWADALYLVGGSWPAEARSCAHCCSELDHDTWAQCSKMLLILITVKH